MALVGAEKVAEAFDVTTRRVYQLVEEGMPKAGRGKYDLGKCLLWYVRFLRAALERKTPQNETAEAQDLKKEKAGLVRVQRETAELELAKMRGEMVSVEDDEKLWNEAVARARGRLLAAVSKHAPSIIGIKKPTVARAKLEVIAHEALSELALLGKEIEEEAG